MATDETERARPLSEVLRDISDDPEVEVTLGEVIDHFGGRAFGALLFVLAIPNLLPLPPGSTTILGAPIAILAPQLALGVRAPWLPRFVDNRPLKRAWLKQAYDRVAPTLQRIEKVSGPRLTFLFDPWPQRLIGVACTALAFVLILPIPLGNIMPSIVIGLFGLSLVQRDGVLALIAYALTAISAGLLVVGFTAAWIALQHVLDVVGWL